MRIFFYICLYASLALPQEFDTVLRHSDRRATNPLDQIENPAERRAFENLLNEKDAFQRRSKAAAFLRDYPDSWLHAQVYEAAARACFELGDHATGTFYARRSLRLYPENALLTATLAAALANKGGIAEGREYARATLDYLERFLPPASMSARDWQPVRDRLRETALLVLGDSPARARTAISGAYAGSQSCKPCHQPQWTAWSATGMARMLRKMEPAAVMADFASLDHPGARATGNALELRRANGAWDRYPIDFVIGSKWQQAYATRAPSGDLHVLPLQYNRLEKSWINYWRMIDPPGSERAVLANFHNLREVTSYQRNCAPCHTSQVSENAFAEPGVNCEMCHGPMAAHAKGAAPAFRFSAVDNRAYVEVCAQCHAQSAVREKQSFPPRYQRRPYAEFSRKAFYRDGRFRETTFIVEAFERSACFRKGQAHCGHCHNPHPPDAAANPVSLKYRDDRMCLQCHEPRYAAVQHTRHRKAQCVDCHMPKIMNALLFNARNHQIDDRPDAEATARYGPVESPNACLDCHADREPEWLKHALAARRP